MILHQNYYKYYNFQMIIYIGKNSGKIFEIFLEYVRQFLINNNNSNNVIRK